VPVVGVNTAGDERGAALTADEKTIVIARRAVGTNQYDLFVAEQRADGTGFDEPRLLSAVNSPVDELGPSLSADGSELYFHHHPPGASNGYTIYRSRRESMGTFTAPVSVDGINSLQWEMEPYWIPGGLYYTRDESLWRKHETEGTTVADGLDPAPVNGVVVTRDEKALYYANVNDERVAQIWLSTRVAPNAGFTRTVGVPELDDTEPHIDTSEYPEWLSPDSCRLYFTAAHPGGAGGFDLWVAERVPD
jgi:hypothetical protein